MKTFVKSSLLTGKNTSNKIFSNMRHRKKTKVKRLKTNEVLLVAEMQGKIDFYERFLTDIHRMILRGKSQLIPNCKYSSWETGEIYKFVTSKLSENNG